MTIPTDPAHASRVSAADANSSEVVACVSKLKALADGTRLAVMEALMDGPQRVGELGERLGVEQSLLSHHLRVLRELGLIQAERVGKSVVYGLAPETGGSGDERALDLGCCRLSFEESGDA